MQPNRHPILKGLRNAFITGLILLLPVGVTFIVINLLIKNVGAPMSNYFFFFLDPTLRSKPWIDPFLDIAATFVVFTLITLLGIFSRYFFGRLLFSVTEAILGKLPLVKNVYKTAKQIVNTFTEEQRAVFQKVVLVEYPRKGTYSLGFITSITRGEVQDKTGQIVVNVFIPTTPNPTSGFLLMIPQEDIIEMDMSVGEGMKLVISGGALVPPYIPPLNKSNNKEGSLREKAHSPSFNRP